MKHTFAAFGFSVSFFAIGFLAVFNAKSEYAFDCGGWAIAMGCLLAITSLALLIAHFYQERGSNATI